MIGRRQFLAATATTVALPAYLRRAWAQSPEVELKLHHFLGPKSPAQVKMFEPWAAAIEDASDGRVSMRPAPIRSSSATSRRRGRSSRCCLRASG